MKDLKNWRWWVLYALFAAGFFTLILAFGEDERPIAEWIEVRVCYAMAAAVCFRAHFKLTRKWEDKAKIETPKDETLWK